MRSRIHALATVALLALASSAHAQHTQELSTTLNADGSLHYDTSTHTIQVGVLATDAQHGVRGGGTQHAVATSSAAGFESAAEFTKLAALPATAPPTSRQIITTAPLAGGGDFTADRTLSISAASGSAAGSMSSADYTKLASYPSTDAPYCKIDGSRAFTGEVAGVSPTLSASLATRGYVLSVLPTTLPPTAHASTHQFGGADVVGNETATAHAIVQATSAGTIAIGYIPTGTSSSTVAIGNDSRITGAVPNTRNVNTTAPLTGGTALSGDLTLGISAASGSNAGSFASADYTALHAFGAETTYSLVNGTRAFTGAIREAPSTVAFASSEILDVNSANDFEIGTLTGNVTISFTNGTDGRTGNIYVIQDGTGSRTVTFTPPGSYVVKHDSNVADLSAATPAGALTIYTYSFYTVGSTNVLAIQKSFQQ